MKTGFWYVGLVDAVPARSGNLAVENSMGEGRKDARGLGLDHRLVDSYGEMGRMAGVAGIRRSTLVS